MLSKGLTFLELVPSVRYGICAFDTSAYYGPSEIVLGNILETLRAEFPRSSYQLVCFSEVADRKPFPILLDDQMWPIWCLLI